MRSLVGYLTLHCACIHDRSQLADEIWGDDSPSQRPADRADPRPLLNQEISRLRKLLPAPDGSDGLFLSTSTTIGVNPRAIRTDVGRFNGELYQAARASTREERRSHLSEATRIYREGGELLPGVNHEWVVAERHTLAARYEQAEEELAMLRGSDGFDSDLDEMKRHAGRESARYVERLNDHARAALNTPEQKQWIERLDAERQSCLAAVEWEIQQDRAPKLVGSQVLRYVWRSHGRREVATWLDARLNSPGFVAPTPRPWVLSTLGWLNFFDDRKALGRRQMSQALALFTKMDRRPEVAGSLTSLGWMAEVMGDHRTHIRCSLQAAAEYDGIGLRQEAAACRVGVVESLLRDGKHREARRLADEAAVTFARLHDPSKEALAVMRAAACAAVSGDRAAAESLFSRGESMAKAIGDVATEAYATDLRALAAELRHEYVVAARNHALSAQKRSALGYAASVVTDLGQVLWAIDTGLARGQAQFLLDDDRIHSLAVLIRAYRRLVRETSNPLDPKLKPAASDLESRVTAILGKSGMADAERESRSVTPTAVASLAVKVVSSP